MPIDLAFLQNYYPFNPRQETIPVATQLLRDRKALSLLNDERLAGEFPLTKVNKSKNPRKELWKEGSLEDEIARRLLMMKSLEDSLPKEEMKKEKEEVKKEEEDPLIAFLKSTLLGDY